MKGTFLDPANLDTLIPSELEKPMTNDEFEKFMKEENEEIDIESVSFSFHQNVSGFSK